MADEFLQTIKNEAVRLKTVEVSKATGLNHKLAYFSVMSGLDSATNILLDGIKEHNENVNKAKTQQTTGQALEALRKELADLQASPSATNVQKMISIKPQISELQNQLR